jgi:hypothetical protein
MKIKPRVKGMRVARLKTLPQENRYLEETYLVWWERGVTVEPAHSDNAHRPLDKSHNLAASLSHVEMGHCVLRSVIPMAAKVGFRLQKCENY